MKIKILFLFINIFYFLPAFSTTLPKPPKLVLVLVYDQLRADLLTQNSEAFLPPTQKNGKLGGFRFLMEKGSYFPFAEYEVLQSMTCPGHAMILTGSYPYSNGISLNEFFDTSKNKSVYCAEDAKDLLSPRKLKGSTVGDELKMNSSTSKVVTVALKDRSAIMLGGHAADLSLWLDNDEMKWDTSTYYSKNLKLDWLDKFNEKVKILKDTDAQWKPVFTKANFSHKAKAQSGEALGFPLGVELTNQIALELIKNYKLGQNSKTDLIAVSFSSHDISGHKYGPNSAEMIELSLHEDYLLSDFLNKLKEILPNGLKDVLIVLTADHGVAPTFAFSQQNKIDSGEIDAKQFLSNLNSELKTKFGEIENTPWIAAVKSFNFYFSEKYANSANRKAALEFSKNWLQTQAGVASAFTSEDYLNNKLPPAMLGQQILKSYNWKINGDFILIPNPFWFEKSEKNKATHMTGYTYDRTVPLIFWGGQIKSEVFSQSAKVVDIAPTLSYFLKQLAPALSEGRNLSEFIEIKKAK